MREPREEAYVGDEMIHVDGILWENEDMDGDGKVLQRFRFRVVEEVTRVVFIDVDADDVDEAHGLVHGNDLAWGEVVRVEPAAAEVETITSRDIVDAQLVVIDTADDI